MWTIETTNYKFRIIQDTDDFDRVIYRLQGTKVPCVVIIHDGDTLILENVSYYPSCAINKQLEKQTGTVEMVKAALKFVIDFVEKTKITKIMLSDNSRFTCKPIGSVKLSEYSFLTRGYTWYENQFGAVSSNSKQYNMFKTFLYSKPDVLFETLKTVIFEKATTEQLIKIKQCYENAKTWQEFAAVLDKEYSCVFLAPYVKSLLAMIRQPPGLFELPFIIDIATIKKYDVDIKIIKSGGSRTTTRKRYLAGLKSRLRPKSPENIKSISWLPIEILETF